MNLTGRRVVLGVSGGIASYKACIVARRLVEAGAEVHAVLTPSATEFVRPVTFEALTGRPALTSLWEPDRALSHIHLAQQSDLIIVAPATASLIARAAQGIADDFLTAILLAHTAPLLIAPAMNDRMFVHPATAANLKVLQRRGATVVGPAVGPLAEGPSDLPGRMSEPEEILVHAERILRGQSGALAGKRVVVTAGPTREPLDPVRVLTNRSSGRMGFALAAAAFARGADVTLIAGPTELTPPLAVPTVRIETAKELQKQVTKHLAGAHVLIMAAAPADFHVARPAKTKRPRGDGPVELALEPTADILKSTIGARGKGAVVVGFALETDASLDRAREKLKTKKLDLIVLNQANEPGAGFEVDTNRVTLITPDGDSSLPLMSKRDVAEQVLDAIERLL